MKQRAERTEIKSKWRGVSWHSHSFQCRCQIRVNGNVKHIGCFECEHDAATAYNFAAERYHGAKAIYNNSDENQNQEDKG